MNVNAVSDLTISLSEWLHFILVNKRIGRPAGIAYSGKIKHIWQSLKIKSCTDASFCWEWETCLSEWNGFGQKFQYTLVFIWFYLRTGSFPPSLSGMHIFFFGGVTSGKYHNKLWFFIFETVTTFDHVSAHLFLLVNGSPGKWFLELESRWYVLISVVKYLRGKYTKTNYKKIKHPICLLPNPINSKSCWNL